ncbi:hypothetical protein SEUCBS140593_004474 [Sporothrix eucalyptigena]|uniref:WLM domain-containing protein n=1 Tax=Sporothrix eucalyptigena TaxID=1812306 RepID=A0ABP0BNJ0_9PEZI
MDGVESPASDTPGADTLEIAVTYAGKMFTLHLLPQSTVEDVALLCENELHESTNTEYTVTKLLAPMPIGLVNVAKDAHTTIADLVARQKTPSATLKLRLMASPTSAVDALRRQGDAVKQRATRLADLRRRAVPARTTRKARVATLSGGGSDEYTFGEIRPLPHLPDPDRALAYLYRLRDDPGIRHAMQSRKFKVGLLTEMDPRLYTDASHEGTSRTLGLNRNAGAVIELRLRTDDFTGYRDYKTVRRTLCHELAHNVFGPHDSKFWALYREIEREVESVAAKSEGRSLEEGDFYEPSAADEEGEHVDGGGLIGGTYVLGGSPSTPATFVDAGTARERRARAAEERLRQTDRNSSGSGSEAHPSGGSPPNQ